MRKSLAIIASALLLAVAAATHDRLRYDSTVFADAAVAGAERMKRVEYPACKKGVREDRCIQLYERGVKRNYKRWLAAHGRGADTAAASGPRRTYRACRGRNDDRCQQRASTRQARANRQARMTPVQRRAAARRATARTQAQTEARAQTRARVANRAAARQQRATTRQRQVTRAPAPQRRSSGSGTPGI